MLFWWLARDSRRRYLAFKRKYPDAIILLESRDDKYMSYYDSAEHLRKEFENYYTNRNGDPGIAIPCSELKGRLEKLDDYAWVLKKTDIATGSNPIEPAKPAAPVKPVEKSPADTQKDAEYVAFREKMQALASERSCDNCMERKSERCTQIKNQLCSDYRPLPYFSEAEKANWPKYGDATAARLGEKNRYV